MRPRCRSGTGWLAVALLLVRVDGVSSLTSQTADDFTPVAPAGAIHAALTTNLKILSDWLDQKDYASAAVSAQELMVLTQLYRCQSGEPAWRERVTALRERLKRLEDAAKTKDADGCRKGLQECEAQLTELAKGPPRGVKATEKGFKPEGVTHTWMLLLDGTYSDAKTARSAKELEDLAYTLAEGANALAHQRADARWRQAAREVRDAALAVAGKAHAGELEPARLALKSVYQRCEACHENYKR